jgi:hypothetical protein
MTCRDDAIIDSPVLRRRSPPAIRNALMLISKKFKTAMPVNMAVIIVMNEVVVDMKQSLCYSLGCSPSQSSRYRGIAGMLLATAMRPSRK